MLFCNILNKFRKNNKELLNKIIMEYDHSCNNEDLDFVNYLKKNIKFAEKLFDVDYAPAFIFGAEWPLDYLEKDYNLDMYGEYPNVIYHGKRVYMPANMTKSDILAYIRSVDIEQDKRSAHCYHIDNRDLKGKIVVDIGAAEGNFVIDFIDEIKHLYLFETDPQWIEPLKRTYAQWLDKVTIVKRAVGDGQNDTLRLDEYFRDKELPNIIKMDVEGVEQSVLIGCHDIFSTNRDLIVFVCIYHSGNDEQRIMNMMNGFSYEINPGKMFYLWESPIGKPYLRHGVVKFRKVNDIICL